MAEAAEFDPRRAEPGQEFSYIVASDDRTIGEDAEIPPGADDLGLVLDSDGKSTGKRTIRVYGIERTLKADDQGIVRPKTSRDEQVLDSFGLTRHGPAVAAAKADAKAADTKKSEG